MQQSLFRCTADLEENTVIFQLKSSVTVHFCHIKVINLSIQPL